MRKSLQMRDYCENIYLSIKDVGAKVFRECAYFETESWVFIWTLDDSFVFSKKLIGDFVLVHPNETMVSLKKEKPVYGN